MSTQVVRVAGFTKGSLGAIGREAERANVTHRNPDIDPDRSVRNMVFKETKHGFYAEWKQIMEDLHVQYRDTKTGIAFEGMVITAEKKFFEEKFDWDPDKPFSGELLDFWDKNYEWLLKEVGYRGTDANIISAIVHADETSLHLQAYYVPVIDHWKEKVYAKGEDGKVLRNEKGSPIQAKDEAGKPIYREVEDPEAPKLSRSEFWRQRGGSTSYSQMQDRYHEEIGKSYGLERGEVGSNKEHRTKAQWEADQLKAEQKQLAESLKDYREMKAGIAEIDQAGRTIIPGYVLVKKKDLEQLKDQAKTYVANRDDLDLTREGMRHLHQLQLAQQEEEKRLRAKEKDLQYKNDKLDHAISDYEKLYNQQLTLNIAYQDLKKDYSDLKLERNLLYSQNTVLKTEISALKDSIEKRIQQAVEPLKRQIESISSRLRGAFEMARDAVKAIGVMKHDKESLYHVDGLTDQQGKLIDGVADYVAGKAREAGFEKIAEDIDKHVNISPEIKKMIEPKRMLNRDDRDGR